MGGFSRLQACWELGEPDAMALCFFYMLKRRIVMAGYCNTLLSTDGSQGITWIAEYCSDSASLFSTNRAKASSVRPRFVL